MRAGAILVGLAVAAAAGLMAYLWTGGGECGGAPVFRSVAACVSAGRSQDACAALMRQADTVLAGSGPVHNTREQCEDRFVTCQRSIGATGFVPRAQGFCVRRGPPETVVPVFGRAVAAEAGLG
jgi:uncharacterized protein YgiB involved in biofilm formation